MLVEYIEAITKMNITNAIMRGILSGPKLIPVYTNTVAVTRSKNVINTYTLIHDISTFLLLSYQYHIPNNNTRKDDSCLHIYHISLLIVSLLTPVKLPSFLPISGNLALSSLIVRRYISHTN